MAWVAQALATQAERARVAFSGVRQRDIDRQEPFVGALIALETLLNAPGFDGASLDPEQNRELIWANIAKRVAERADSPLGLLLAVKQRNRLTDAEEMV